ncbi:unnamed protein product [Rotaria magnacalcarata]|uniref:Uncharacterized protein n=1 Tax=Rotaria magnacalcarata TaxID=392030 RepID=A0A815F2S5_9BILA|nr:unnamed protein product [Rotaria magnacalcarata]CAF1470650.1 unnamed protein product [Rotaria magnacalcarata]CAF2044490.1 unnamed protein product [Rotaria magnacalcarata]CAF2091810.1 unnamed protein product [Rotaria magnacalcarata]CAF2245242.1 unnamed protein product [Rotaria magnacalcarata]
MNYYQYRVWLTFNNIKTLFGYRNQQYQSVSQSELSEAKCSIDENKSFMDDQTLIDNRKSSSIDHINNINIKQIDEILPLMTDKSINLKLIVPISTYTNGTQPDVDLLEF